MRRCETVDEYIESSESWQAELVRLREILTSTPLVETVKWGAPCYTHNDKMVVGIGAFKSYVGLWFHQGALLSDESKVLINAQEGKTKALRQWRFNSKKEIKARLIKSYVKEAIQLQDGGQEIKADRSQPVVIPPELEKALAASTRLKKAFGAFTKGRQREFADYIAEAKRDATKEKRLEKIIPMIEDGIGLNDKYRNC
ncbi:MAG: DUF1801 domain-containing protein [Planctomycetota bacterium]